MARIAILLVPTLVALLVAKDALGLNNKNNTKPDSQQCIERVGELDKCLPKLVFYGDRNFEPPRTDAQLDAHCQVLDDNLKCVSSYSRECLPSFARNLYSVVLRRLKAQFAKRCKTKDGRSDFLNMMACADTRHMEPAHKCMDSFVAQLEHIGNGNQNRQIELTCCTFQLFQECIFAASKRMQCSHRLVTAEKSNDYVKTVINTMGGDMLDFMCGRFEKISNCIAGYPKIMLEFNSIQEKIQNGTMKPRSRTPLKPMLQLFIDSQEL